MQMSCRMYANPEVNKRTPSGLSLALGAQALSQKKDGERLEILLVGGFKKFGPCLTLGVGKPTKNTTIIYCLPVSH